MMRDGGKAVVLDRGVGGAGVGEGEERLTDSQPRFFDMLKDLRTQLIIHGTLTITAHEEVGSFLTSSLPASSDT
jgi:hypothetical protein